MILLKKWYQNNIIGKNVFIWAITLCLITLPLSKLGLNNLAIGVFGLIFLLNWKNLKFHSNFALYLPIIYYLWLLASLLWSIDLDASVRAISKEIGLLVFPLLFLFIPSFEKKDIDKVLKIYSYSVTIYGLYLLGNAFVRYLGTQDMNVFFYHELVTLEINAIYISAIVALAILHLIRTKYKNLLAYSALSILITLLILLSSKNIIIITLLLIVLNFLIDKRIFSFKQYAIILSLIILIISLFSGKIIERFDSELKDVQHNVVLENGVENVSIMNTLTQENFNSNHYFSGSSIRVYQARLLYEFNQEYNIFWQGFGVNAAQKKIEEKQIIRGYQHYFGTLNFHNQYLQSFAELGMIGFLIFIGMLVYSIIRAIKTRNYYLLTFILLIACFCVTESIFSRQRGIVIFITFYTLLHHHIKRTELV